MKKILITMALLLLVSVGAEAQEKTNFGYVCYDHTGSAGMTFGLGFTLGRVSVIPTTRWSFNDEALSTGGINYEKSVGIEVVYWPDFTTSEKWKVGLMASPVQIDWLEAQDRSLPEYITQSAGIIGVYYFSEKLGAIGAIKGTDQLFDTDSQFKERLRFIVGVFGRL